MSDAEVEDESRDSGADDPGSLDTGDDRSDVALATTGGAELAHQFETTPPLRRKPLDKGLLAACFVIACGLFAIIWGVGSAVTGNEGVDRPEAIESLSPVENARQVFQQEQIRVDLQSGYEAILVVDGIELETTNIGQVEVNPENDGQQVSIPPTAVFDPGNAVITFRPSDGAAIESFTEGRHTAQVIYWRIEEGRDSAVSYRWSFEVV